jgi:hypothetical protein
MKMANHVTTLLGGMSIAAGVGIACQISPAMAEDPIIAGYVERVRFNNNEFALKAKLDTGAKTSTINAPEYEIFKKDGRQWVRFQLANEKGRKLVVKRKIERFARIRRAGTVTSERPVIKMKVCIGGTTGFAEFTLSDRQSMNYQVLIGRSFMTDRILIDPGKSFLVSDRCEG